MDFNHIIYRNSKTFAAVTNHFEVSVANFFHGFLSLSVFCSFLSFWGMVCSNRVFTTALPLQTSCDEFDFVQIFLFQRFLFADICINIMISWFIQYRFWCNDKETKTFFFSRSAPCRIHACTYLRKSAQFTSTNLLGIILFYVVSTFVCRFACRLEEQKHLMLLLWLFHLFCLSLFFCCSQRRRCVVMTRA